MMQGELVGGLMMILGYNGTLFIAGCGNIMNFYVEILRGRSRGLMTFLLILESGAGEIIIFGEERLTTREGRLC
jgi:hypothetical protein